MANKIQIRRGNKANLPTLSAGEPAFCTDTKQLFIGTGSGNIEYAKQSDVNIINSQLNDLTNKRNILTYTSLDQLGLTSSATIQVVIKALPDNSTFISSINDNIMVTILAQCPVGYGTLIIEKRSISRTFIRANNGNTTAQLNNIYYCNYDNDLDAISSWKQIATDDDIKNIDGRNDVAKDANKCGVVGQKTVYQGDGSTLNTPYTAGLTGATSSIIESYLSSSAYGIQICYPSGTNKIFTRTLASGSWGSWVEVVKKDTATSLWTGSLTLTTTAQSITLADDPSNYSKLRVSFGGANNFINLDVRPWYDENYIRNDNTGLYHIYAGSTDITLDFTGGTTKCSVKSTSSIALRGIYGIKEGAIW